MNVYIIKLLIVQKIFIRVSKLSIKIKYKGISVQENSINQENGFYGIKLYIYGTKWVKKFLHGLLGLKHF